MGGSALCPACADIFSIPRDIGFAAIPKRWLQTPASFREALQNGCHLCHLISQNSTLTDLVSYNDRRPVITKDFSKVRYAFRPVSTSWAETGRGHPLSSPSSTRGDWETGQEYLEDIDCQPEIQELKRLVVEEPEKLASGEATGWFMLEFSGIGFEIHLPMEAWGGSDIEEATQTSIFQQASTGSAENFQLASLWLDQCRMNHPECRPLYEDSHWLPTRLLHVGSVTNPRLHLVRGADLPPGTPYAALSHTWGLETGPALTRAQLESFFSGISTNVLSRTMMHAVEACRSLKIEYIWIDGVCIVQHDKDDWEAESVTMSKVYGCSTLTITAASSHSGGGDMFSQRNHFRIRPLKVSNPFRGDSDVSFAIHAQNLSMTYKAEVKKSHWHSRSWTFQERVLSQRLLIFGQQQLIWACQRMQAAESCPVGKSSRYFIDRFESFETEKLRLRNLLNPVTEPSSAVALWNALVADYTSTTTSRSSDRLVALQGIADRIAGATGRTYVYGLWLSDNWPWELCWHVSSRCKLPTEYRAPSWSWGSVDGQIGHLFSGPGQGTATKVSPNPEFRDNATRLMFDAPLLEATLELSMSGKNSVTLRRRRATDAQTHGPPLAPRVTPDTTTRLSKRLPGQRPTDQANTRNDRMRSNQSDDLPWMTSPSTIAQSRTGDSWALSHAPRLDSVPEDWMIHKRPYKPSPLAESPAVEVEEEKKGINQEPPASILRKAIEWIAYGILIVVTSPLTIPIAAIYMIFKFLINPVCEYLFKVTTRPLKLHPDMKPGDVEFYRTRSMEEGTAYGMKNKKHHTIPGRKTKAKRGPGRGGSQKQAGRKVGEERESPPLPSALRVHNKEQQAGQSGGRGDSGGNEIEMLSSQQPHHGTQAADDLRPRTKLQQAVATINDDRIPASVFLDTISSEEDARGMLPVRLLFLDDGRGLILKQHETVTPSLKEEEGGGGSRGRVYSRLGYFRCGADTSSVKSAGASVGQMVFVDRECTVETVVLI